MSYALMAILVLSVEGTQARVSLDGIFPSQHTCERALQLLIRKNENVIGTCKEIPNE